MKSCNKKELEFTVFIINKLSNYLKKPVYEIYKVLEDLIENEKELFKLN